MSRPKRVFYLWFLIVLLLWGGQTFAASGPVEVKMGRGRAQITVLNGNADLVKVDQSKVRTLKEGDFLARGSIVKTGADARIELKLPDRSYIRFAENTTFELVSLAINKKNKRRDVRVKMMVGKTWAKVAKNRRGRFALSAKTAVAGVRGTTYRMNVNPDESVVIKVYWGEILVEAKEQAEAGQTKPKAMSKPKRVLGPTPIAGPRAVTLEEWTYIVSSLQQINISPDGKPQKPFRFDIMADLNDWVRWNKERDKLLKGEEYQE